MAVIRVNKTSDYTIMGNSHLKEKEMSLKAKGLLSMMLSLPNDWDYSVAGLVSICKESESSIKTALDELKKFGYLVIEKKLPNETDSGKFEYEYNIFEYPQGEEQPTEIKAEIQVTEKPKEKAKVQDIHTPVVERYNRICVSLPKVTTLTDKRKKAINARLKQYSMVEIEEVFLIAESNDFLKGKKGKWKATFDWLMNENNFVKVLEGNYNDTNNAPQKETEHDRFMSGLLKFVEGDNGE